MKSVVKIAEKIILMVSILIMISALLCQIFQIKPAVVVSGSMEPAIKTGSLAFINKQPKTIKEGDVISFDRGGLSVTHRIVKVTGDGYITKGDNNNDADFGIVKEHQVDGKVFFVIPGLGFFLKTIVLPAGSASILLYIIIRSINRGKRYD